MLSSTITQRARTPRRTSSVHASQCWRARREPWSSPRSRSRPFTASAPTAPRRKTSTADAAHRSGHRSHEHAVRPHRGVGDVREACRHGLDLSPGPIDFNAADLTVRAHGDLS